MVKDKSVTRSQVSDVQASVCFSIPIWSVPKWTRRSLSPKNLQKHREKQRKRFRSTLSFSLWSRSYPQRSLQYSENFLKEPKLRQGSPHLSWQGLSWSLAVFKCHRNAYLYVHLLPETWPIPSLEIRENTLSPAFPF